MKTFYCIVSNQIQGELKDFRYEAVDNTRLALDMEIAFPILTAVAGYVEPGEAFRVVAAYPPQGRGPAHFERFRAQLAQVCARKGLAEPQVIGVKLPGERGVAGQAAVFRALTAYARDNDDIFACMTFGTKPLTSALLMAVRYAYRVKENARVSCVVYGEISRPQSDVSTWKAQVYDMTALIEMDELVRRLADRKVSDPWGAISAVLGLEGSHE